MRTVDVETPFYPARQDALLGRAIMSIAGLRDAMALGLGSLGATPNMLSMAGFALTCLGSLFLLIGAGHGLPWGNATITVATSWLPLITALLLFIAFALDILDGALARLGGATSRFGAILDSTLDRIGDQAVLGSCALHFAWQYNLTYVALSMAALANASLISYVKARSESVVEHCRVGAWQRGERCGVFLFAAFVGHIPTVLWILGTFPLLTAVRRLRHAQLLATTRLPHEPSGWLYYLQPWRHRRGSSGYCVWIAALFVFIILAPRFVPLLRPDADPLRTLANTWLP